MRIRSTVAFLFAFMAFLLIFTFLFTPHLLFVIAWGKIGRVAPKRHRTRVARAATFWADIAFRVCAWLLQIHVEFQQPECAHEPIIVISNHQSTLDILLIASILRRCKKTNARWILKSGLHFAPIVGIVGKEMGCAFVSRTGDPLDLEHVKTSARLAREDGASVILFPEGTRGSGPYGTNGFQHVLRPKPGGFKTLRAELPGYSVLSVTLCWHPPIKRGLGKTMFQGAAFFGKKLIVTAEMIHPKEIAADPHWLANEWERKEDALARLRTSYPSPHQTA